VASLVSEVEAAGIVPASTWSWTMGDTSASCGTAASPGGSAGCTSWSSGVEHTVFSGSPTLALVAHEVANAEVEHFAAPALLQQAGAAAAETSWSPTDAAASCLVAHFLGFQDRAAGPWECPVALAASIAAHIHDTLVTTHLTAVCGASSGIASTLVFNASAGTLTVTSPTATRTVPAGTPVTVSGVGTFTAQDLGGTVTVAGVCEG
jgi:3D (Asp-Asp-Asp) domain-containing protein